MSSSNCVHRRILGSFLDLSDGRRSSTKDEDEQVISEELVMMGIEAFRDMFRIFCE